MIKQAKARLQWLVPIPSDGSAPRGRRFSMPAKFDHQGDDWTDYAWSLVVESDNKLDDRRLQDVQVHFLMPNAPAHWLVRGKRFTLQEGFKSVANGELM